MTMTTTTTNEPIIVRYGKLWARGSKLDPKYSAAIQTVLAVLRDGSRTDRYLRRTDDGRYYTTPDLTHLRPDGSTETPPYVFIPVSDGDGDDEEWARELVSQLD